MLRELFQHSLGCNAPWVHPTGLLLVAGGWVVFKNLTIRITSEKSMLWDQRNNTNSQKQLQNSINKIADIELYLLTPIALCTSLISLTIFNRNIYNDIRVTGEQYSFYEPWSHAFIIGMCLILSLLVGFVFYAIKRVSKSGSTGRKLFLGLFLAVELIFMFFILRAAKTISLPANHWETCGWVVAICAVIGIGIYVYRAYQAHAKAFASGLLALSVVIDMVMYATVLYGLGSYIWSGTSS